MEYFSVTINFSNIFLVTNYTFKVGFKCIQIQYFRIFCTKNKFFSSQNNTIFEEKSKSFSRTSNIINCGLSSRHKLKLCWSQVCKSATLIDFKSFFTPQPLRAVGVLFSPMVSRWAGQRVSGQWEKSCPDYISETVRCRKLILGRDIGWGVYRCATSWCDLDLTFDLAVVTLSLKILNCLVLVLYLYICFLSFRCYFLYI